MELVEVFRGDADANEVGGKEMEERKGREEERNGRNKKTGTG